MGARLIGGFAFVVPLLLGLLGILILVVLRFGLICVGLWFAVCFIGLLLAGFDRFGGVLLNYLPCLLGTLVCFWFNVDLWL